ncbi:MAG: heme exporter protein CcmB [Pseudomonadales bacterium]
MSARPGPAGLFRAQLQRELVATARSLGEALNPLLFLFLAIALFAIGLGGQREALQDFAGGIIWVLVLLANLLALEGLFRRDYDDGTLEQMILLARPGFVPVLAKVLAQWCVTGLAMTLIAPLAALLLYLPGQVLGTALLTLLVGSPALTVLGAVGAALTVGLRRGGVLLALLVLPLYVPTLIFGAGAILQASLGLGASAQIYWLMAISMLAVTLGPFAVLAALKISLEQ